MRCDRIPPSRLIYETAAVLSVRTSTCLPYSSGRNCRKAKCTAHSSRQLMCQSSRGPVQSPEAACPLHVAPQPVLEASVVTTVCRDTCSRGTPARRKARSVQGLRERRHCWEIPTRSVPLGQFSTAWARSSVRRAVILTESNSTPRKEILCTGESLHFSQLTRSPG